MEGPTSFDQHNNDLLIDSFNGKPTEQAGILPRTALFMQQEIQRYKQQFSKQITYEVSALEIYCENIRDLLSDNESYLQLKNNGNKIVCPG